MNKVQLQVLVMDVWRCPGSLDQNLWSGSDTLWYWGGSGRGEVVCPFCWQGVPNKVAGFDLLSERRSACRGIIQEEKVLSGAQRSHRLTFPLWAQSVYWTLRSDFNMMDSDPGSFSSPSQQTDGVSISLSISVSLAANQVYNHFEGFCLIHFLFRTDFFISYFWLWQSKN